MEPCPICGDKCLVSATNLDVHVRGAPYFLCWDCLIQFQKSCGCYHNVQRLGDSPMSQLT